MFAGYQSSSNHQCHHIKCHSVPAWIHEKAVKLRCNFINTALLQCFHKFTRVLKCISDLDRKCTSFFVRPNSSFSLQRPIKIKSHGASRENGVLTSLEMESLPIALSKLQQSNDCWEEDKQQLWHIYSRVASCLPESVQNIINFEVSDRLGKWKPHCNETAQNHVFTTRDSVKSWAMFGQCLRHHMKMNIRWVSSLQNDCNIKANVYLFPRRALTRKHTTKST